MLTILTGGPGCGKTTIASVIANVTNKFYASLNAVTDGVADLRKVTAAAEENLAMYGRQTILFIDEIHRLTKSVEEYLYSAMEDYAIDIMIDQGPNARSVRLELPRFTLVGATTRIGLIDAPLRARFGLVNRLDFYVAQDLAQIVVRSAAKLGVDVDSEGALEIARRSRGTPRIANNLLRRVRDFAQVKAGIFITGPVAREALSLLEIDPDGLDEMDIKILETICVKFSGGPVGLSTIAVTVGEQPDTIEEAYELFLIMQGYIERTPKGRLATQKAVRKLRLSI